MIILFVPLVVGYLSFLASGDLRAAPASRFQPDAKVFSIVWPILYLLIGYSAYRIEKVQNTIPPIFFVQLLLNFTWSIAYTKLGAGTALINIILLLFAIFLTIVSFYGIDEKASYVLIPYFLWVSFATFLNFDVFKNTVGNNLSQ